MSDRRLLILDAYDADVLRRETDGGAWDVLLLGLNESLFRSLAPDLPRADTRVRFLDPALLAPRAHEEVRAFAAGRLYALPDLVVNERPLRRALEDLGTSWWHTEASELGPYRTPLIFQ